jgi:hypothetical protein
VVLPAALQASRSWASRLTRRARSSLNRLVIEARKQLVQGDRRQGVATA